MTTSVDRTHSTTLGNPSPEAGAGKRFVEQAKKTAQDFQEMGALAKDAAEEKIGNMRESASEHMDQGRAKAQEVEFTMEQYIREHPLKSMLIAAGVGLFLGRFWIRR